MESEPKNRKTRPEEVTVESSKYWSDFQEMGVPAIPMLAAHTGEEASIASTEMERSTTTNVLLLVVMLSEGCIEGRPWDGGTTELTVYANALVL